MIYKKNLHGTARSGFTLIEIIVAISIVAIMAFVVAPNLLNWIKKGARHSTESSLHTLSTAIDTYINDVGSPPQVLEDLIRKPAGLTNREWEGSYLKGKSVPKDGWKKPFVYKPMPNAEPPYELYSYGPKGPGADEEEWFVA